MATRDSSDTDNFNLLPALLKHVEIPQLQFVKDNKDLTFKSIGFGNLNYVIRVEDPGGRNSAILKHAPPYIRCLGPQHPLSPSRGDRDYRALQAFHRHAPGSVPQPYFYDKELNVICMEDLKYHKDFRNELIAGRCKDKVVQKVAKDIALVHKGTHKASVDSDTYSSLLDEFKDSELVSLTEQYIFTKPFCRTDPTNRSSECVLQRGIDLVYNDPAVIAASERMRTLFLEKKECLCHGDLHTESIMVDGEDSKLIDLEFAYMGPPSFDVGMLVANYIFSYYCHMSKPDNHDQRRAFADNMVDMCKLTVNTYLEHMTCHLADRDTYASTMLSEMAGFAGCEIVRRILGTAHVKDLEDDDHANVDALGAGVRLLSAWERIHSIDRLLVIALMLV